MPASWSRVRRVVCSDAPPDQESAWRSSSPRTSRRQGPYSPNRGAVEGQSWASDAVPVIAGRQGLRRGQHGRRAGQGSSQALRLDLRRRWPPFGPGERPAVCRRTPAFSRGSVNGCNGGSNSGGYALDGALDVGDWAAHGTGSHHENKATMSPNAQADRSIVQAPLHHGFRCRVTESTASPVKHRDSFHTP